MKDALTGKYFVQIDEGRRESRGKLLGPLGGAHYVVRYRGESPSLKIVRNDALERFRIFDTFQEAGIEGPADEDDPFFHETV